MDLEPDLVMTFKVPSKPTIQASQLIKMNTFITNPSQHLQRVYAKAEKDIIKQMDKNDENDDPNEFKIRLQGSIKEIQVTKKQVNHINSHEEK